MADTSKETLPAEHAYIAEFPEVLAGRVLLALLEPNHTTEWLPSHVINEAIPDVGRRRIYRLLGSLSITSTEADFKGKTLPCYPPLTTEILSEEFAFKDFYAELPERVNITQIAEAIGRSWSWTNARIEQLGLKQVTLEPGWGRPSRMFHRTAVKKLRDDALELPYDLRWQNVGNIALQTGEDPQWIIRVFDELGIEPQVRRSALTGKSLVSYPVETVKHLQSVRQGLSEAPRGYATENSIAVLTGRNYKWVKIRLENAHELAEVYLDSRGARRVHYPPQVVEALIDESQTLAEASEVDVSDFLLFSEIAELSGKSKGWLRKHLPTIDVPTKEGLDGKNRLKTFYHLSVLDHIKRIDPHSDTKIKDVDGFYTMTQLEQYTCRSRDWIKSRLSKTSHETRKGKNSRGNVATFYSQEALDYLIFLLESSHIEGN